MSKSNAINKNADTPLKQFAKDCGAGGGITIVIASALLCVTAVVLTNVDVPFELHQPITTIITSLATLASTYLIGQKRQKSGLVLGLSVGGLVFLLLFLISAIFGDKVISMQTLVKLVSVLAAGGFGGLFGVSKKTGESAKRAKKILRQ